MRMREYGSVSIPQESLHRGSSDGRGVTTLSYLSGQSAGISFSP